MNSKSLSSRNYKRLNQAISPKESIFPFFLVILYLLLEFGRPQNFIPFLRILHLPALTVMLMAGWLLFSGKLYLKDRQTILYMILMVEMVIHGPIAVNNYWAFQIFYTMTVTLIAYVAIVNIVDNETKYEKLIKYWFIIFIFLAIVGIIKKGKGVGGFLGDENDFCMAFNMILPFSLFGIFFAKTKAGKMYCILLTCFFLFVVIMTQSRGGFVGLVAVAVYCWFKTNKKIVLAFLMGLLVVFSLLIAPTKYWEEVNSITDERTMTYGTGGQRIYAWKLGWKMFIDNPILGVGQGNYPWNVADAEEQLGMEWQTRSLAGRAAHSLYFTLLPELGLVGSILYGMMLFYTLKDLKYLRDVSQYRKDVLSNDDSKRIYYLALAFEGSLVGFLVSSVFISTLYYPNFWILCGFIVSLKKIVYARFGDDTFSNKKYVPKYSKIITSAPT